jgi:hypothetical protein
MILTCEELKKNLKTTFGDSIREYFIDDPSLIAFSSLPAICVCPVSTEIDIIDTARDTWTYTIDIILIIDAKQELNKYKQEIVGTRYLTETMEGKTSAGVLRPNTVLYVLRDNLRLGDNWYINNIASIDYSLRTRIGEGGAQFITKESTLRLSVVRIQNRP